MLENRNAAVAMLLDQRSRFTLSPVSTRVVAIFRWPSTLCLTSHPGQLSFLFVGWKIEYRVPDKVGSKGTMVIHSVCEFTCGWQVIPLTYAILSTPVVSETQHIALYKCFVY